VLHGQCDWSAPRTAAISGHLPNSNRAMETTFPCHNLLLQPNEITRRTQQSEMTNHTFTESRRPNPRYSQ
jgi:hypothetical protein